MGRVLAVLAALIVLAGCAHSQSTDDIGKLVQQSMQQKFDTDSTLSGYRMHVGSVSIINTSGNHCRHVYEARTVCE